jgi:8-oxo-dGTP pyrophosphatase MutT (NUDIX family)/phosphohistidine phosphatase SixA
VADRVEAAGGVLWRGDPAAPEIALVHRPRYDDWSLPKGKVDPGEHPLLAAMREIEEETGFTGRPGRRLGSLRYEVPEGPKRVRYWSFEAIDGEFRANREVDELWWATVPQALARLDPDHDRRVLERFAEDTRPTRALVVVRHASAGDKAGWSGPDGDRPLDAAGRARTRVVGALLAAYAVRRAGAADVQRCRQTLEPWSRDAGVEVSVLKATTAGVFDSDPEEAVHEVLALLDGVGGDGDPAGADAVGSIAWCGQREVIPELVAAVIGRLGGQADADDVGDLRKGGLLLLHVAATPDDRPRLVALERLPG